MTAASSPVTAAQALAKPIPVPDAASAPFFAGALEGKLLLLRCQTCGTFMSPTAYLRVPVRPRCVRCFSSELGWSESGGRAAHYSFAIMQQLCHEAVA